MTHESRDHANFADWDASYVLGALSPADRRDFEKHLETCERCSAAVAELTSMPGLLARLAPGRAEALLDDLPGDSLLDDEPRGPSPQLLDLVHIEDRRRTRRRMTTIAVAAAAAAVAVILAIVLPIALRPGAGPLSQTVAMEALSDVPLTATVTLSPAEWGTRLQLECDYAEADDGDGAGTAWSYGLVVTGTDGTTAEVGSWRISPGSTARISAATALMPDEIQSIEIRPLGGDEALLRADLAH